MQVWVGAEMRDVDAGVKAGFEDRAARCGLDPPAVDDYVVCCQENSPIPR
jgi:hypothetical protein